MLTVFSFSCDEAHYASLYVGEILNQDPETTVQVINVHHHQYQAGCAVYIIF